MILHKINCNGPLNHRRQYLDDINTAYNENFRNLEEYKREPNFNRVLRKISFYEIEAAVNRSKDIMRRNEENGFVLHEYKGYRYYRENPSLSIWESVEKIMKNCELM